MSDVLSKVPPLFIAAFALQESGCDPTTMGQGGEAGMMQISPVSPIVVSKMEELTNHEQDKCTNAPNGNCLDVWYNVRTATSYFADVIKSTGGNVFEAVGQYNGWQRGMSFNEATTWGVNGNCCHCQRNLD
jgi:soluble lytic murein transglycosylase-like protein